MQARPNGRCRGSRLDFLPAGWHFPGVPVIPAMASGALFAFAASFDDVYRRHAPSVHRRARQLLGNDADAHETVQDLFMSLYERPEQFSGKSTLTTLMFRLTQDPALAALAS